MGNNLNEKGEFQSDKYPELDVDKFLLSFKDPIAREAIKLYAEKTEDEGLKEDLLKRVKDFE
ncbi:MAG: hypothetical protein QGF74_03385 [Candidatus Nanoarchaeia archaeon]|jgi:hypothetical protein|nr:hypothetical protein [Candidatus Nanoarchaeia archaeon]|tara:strand:+ start:15192 stop:15377 length:186 start_codon:yes stop_codon:yes gene_type:complete